MAFCGSLTPESAPATGPGMRIAVTSDIHVDKNGPRTLEALVRQVTSLEADVLIVAGDVSTSLTTFLETMLALRPCAEHVLFVAGNHDVWSPPEQVRIGLDAWKRLDEVLPAICAEAGVHDLDRGPVTIGGLGFVGTLGWWDLSMRDVELGAPEEAYATGAYGGLRWMDHVYARFGDDPFPAVAEQLRARLAGQLAEVQADRVAVVTHMVQFREQLFHKSHPGWRFCQAFIGHAALGELARADERVVLSVCGHTHAASQHQLGRLRAVCSPLGYRSEWMGRPDDEAVARGVALVEV